MTDSIAEKVVAVIVDRLGAAEGDVVPEARFKEDLGADSLDLVELIMAFEEEFDCEIAEEEAKKITTVGDAIAYVESHATVA